MAIKGALKRLRQSKGRQLRNKDVRSEVRTHKKKVLAAVEQNNKDEAAAQLRKVVSLYDKAVKKGVIKANNAARNKSRLTAKVNNMA